MKEQDEKRLDHLFKQGLSNTDDHIPYDDRDWKAMEQMLDEQKHRKGVLHHLPALLSGIAAVILLAFGISFLWPKQPQNDKNIVKIKPYKQNPGTSDQDKQQVTEEDTPAAFADTSGINRLKSMVLRGKGNEKESLLNASAAVPGRYNTGLVIGTTKNIDDTSTNQENIAQLLTVTKVDTSVSKTSNVTEWQGMAAMDVSAQTKPDTSETPALAGHNKKKISDRNIDGKLPVTLSIVAAPDFNGVGGSFNRTRVGTNAGLLITVGISRKITVSTGAIYAQKPYMVNFSQYQTAYPFATQPTDVTADCRVLDIPVNINYQLYSRGNNQLSIGTGLSSYFMLRENYRFNYPAQGYYANTYNGPADYNIRNQNRHVLGVLNINAAYQRRITTSFGLNIQPYMKVPLTDIGYGRVNLQSTGVAVGVSWYLRPPAKIQ